MIVNVKGEPKELMDINTTRTEAIIFGVERVESVTLNPDDPYSTAQIHHVYDYKDNLVAGILGMNWTAK